MAAFPGALAIFAGFVASHTLAVDNHAAQHNLEQGEILAVQTKVGTGASTPTVGKVLRGTGVGVSAWAQVDLVSDVTGVLPVASGGTGQNTQTGSGLPVAQTSPTIITPTITSPTITTPTIADFSNAVHTHASNAQGGQLNGAAAITDGTITPAELTAGTGSSWVWQSWSTAAGGFSAKTSDTGSYIQIGTTIIARVLITGTSNSTGFTFSLPVAAARAENITGLRVADNGAFVTTPGYISTAAGSTSATAFLNHNAAASGWTAANAKELHGMIFYEAA